MDDLPLSKTVALHVHDLLSVGSSCQLEPTDNRTQQHNIIEHNTT